MRRPIRKLLAFVIIFLGLSITVGWLTRSALLLQVYHSYPPAAFNTGLLLVLIGIALLFDRFFQSKVLAPICGSLLVILSFAVLAQDIFDFSWGIDQLFVDAWLKIPDTVPGRSTPLANINFMLSGIVFILFPFVTKKFIPLIIECCSYLISLSGLLILISYFFQLEFIYSIFPYMRMSFISSVAFILIGISFWLNLRAQVNGAGKYTGHEDKQIIIISSVTLITIALLTAMISFFESTNYQIKSVGNLFQNLIQVEQDLIVKNINQVFSEIDSIHTTSLFKEAINHPQAEEKLKPFLELFLSQGFSGIRIYDEKQKLILSAGKFIENPSMEARLKLPVHTVLVWKNGWFLKIKKPLRWHNQTGFMYLEWPFSNVTQLRNSTINMSKTMELVVCTPLSDHHAQCFPSRFHSEPHTMFLTHFDQQLPIRHTFQGQSGLKTAYDYRGQKVLAAYSPVSTLGLGMVLKIDLIEIYEPIIANLKVILPLIFLVIFIGILFLLRAVKPLVKKIKVAEQKLLTTNSLLRKEQKRYDLAVVGSQVGLWDWEVGKEEVYYSPYFIKMLGFDEKEWPQTLDTFKKNVHPDDYDKVFAKVEEHLLNHVPYDVEYRLRTKTGEYRWFQAIGQAIWNEKNIPVRMSGSIRDITELKITQQRQACLYLVTQLLTEASNLKEVSPKLLRAMCEGMEWDCGLLWQLDENKQKLIPVGVWQMPGMSLQPFIEFSLKKEFKIDEGIPGRVWGTGQHAWVENILTDPNFPRREPAQKVGLQTGFGFPILLGYQVLGVIEFFSRNQKLMNKPLVDMVETIGPQVGQFIQRKSYETELQKSEALKTAILESASDAILTINKSGYIVAFNAATEKMFNYTAKELQDKNIEFLIPHFENKIALLKNKKAAEIIATRNQGTEFFAEITVSNIQLEKERYRVCIIHDITERKKIESLKDEFISVVSHELRTPLTSIRGSLGLILGGAVGDFSEKAKKLLDIANNNCERLLLLINDILDVEKIEANKMVFKIQPMDINDIVNKAIEMNRPFADKYHVNLKLLTPVENILVNVDPDRLIQVLTNLISNAVKFSPEGETVALDIIKHNNTVRVSVTDKGPGIPQEFKKRIFQKFSQADTSSTRNKSGTGLGLSISKLIIEKLNGLIGFTSQFGEGSVFYFDLPIFEVKKPMPKDQSETSALRFLICEDDESQASYLCELLQSSGYKADIALTVAKAKACLNAHHYDALLLDLILPDQDGIAFIRELRSDPRTEKLPIIVISIISETGKALLKGDGLAVMDWLDKPLDYSKLQKVIHLLKKESGPEKPKILHVEDDESFQQIIAEVLSPYANVIAVETLKEAKEQLKKQSFDLVLLDLLLPDGNGVDLLSTITKKFIPVIVFSAVELDQQYAKYVSEILMKSKTSNEKLIDMIKRNLKTI